MGFKSSKSRKKFFTDLKKAKPDHVEVTISGSIAPIPSLSGQVKTSWDLDNEHLGVDAEKLLQQKLKLL